MLWVRVLVVVVCAGDVSNVCFVSILFLLVIFFIIIKN